MTKLIRKHSQGKQATLYEGATRLGKRVAVKELSKQVRENPRLRDRLFQAAREWANVPHQYLLDYIDVDEDQGWIIADWMDRSVVNLHSCSPSDGLRIMRQSLEALHHLNNKGFFHANLKPTNMLLDEQGDVCLCDGLLLSIDDPGVIPRVGTAKYLAPEMTDSGSAMPGPGIDLYALGFVVLELMMGRSFADLFPGISRETSDHDMAWIAWHTDKAARLPPAAEIVPGCPPEFGIVIDKMLLKDPFDRYRFAKQALEYLPDLSTAVHGSPAPNISPIPARPSQVDNRVRRDHDATPATPVSANHVMPRPSNGVVVVVASGSNAGTTSGIDASTFTVGFDPQCDIVIENDVGFHEDEANLQVQRGSDGWSIRKQHGNGFFLNQKFVGSSAPLRSGDIVRLSWKGPDFQFYLQSGSPSVNELAATYLREAKPKTPSSPQRKGASRRAPTSQPQPQPQAPRSAAPQAPRPPAPSGPQQPSPQRPNPRQPSPQRPSPPQQGGDSLRQTRQVSKPQGPRDVRTTSPVASPHSSPGRQPAAAPSAPTSPHAAAPHAPISQASQSHQPGAPNAPGGGAVQQPLAAVRGDSKVVWSNPKTWDKATKDKVLIGVAAIVAILVVVLFPTGGSETDSQSSDTEMVATNENANQSEPPAIPDSGAP